MRPTVPAAPLEWHPAYADKTWLLDWLTGTGHEVILLPIPRRSIFTKEISEMVVETTKTMTMTRMLASGPAAYVGRPFTWKWNVGVDNLGRQIASDSWRDYGPGPSSLPMWDDYLDLPREE